MNVGVDVGVDVVTVVVVVVVRTLILTLTQLVWLSSLMYVLCFVFMRLLWLL